MKTKSRIQFFDNLLRGANLTPTEQQLQRLAETYPEEWQDFYIQRFFTAAMLSALLEFPVKFQEKWQSNLTIRQERNQTLMYKILMGQLHKAYRHQPFVTYADLLYARQNGILQPIVAPSWTADDNFWARKLMSEKVSELYTVLADAADCFRLTSSARFNGLQQAYFHFGLPTLPTDLYISPHNRGLAVNLAVPATVYNQLMSEVDHSSLHSLRINTDMHNLPTIPTMLKYGVFADGYFHEAWQKLNLHAGKLDLKVVDLTPAMSMNLSATHPHLDRPNPLIMLYAEE